MSFVHLHCHSEYSLLDGANRIEDLIKRAQHYEMPGLAITDHGNIDGVIQFQKACDKYNLKSILGCELYVVPDIEKKEQHEKRYHLTCLIQNQTGWNNLCQMLTIANLQGFYRERCARPCRWCRRSAASPAT